MCLLWWYLPLVDLPVSYRPILPGLHPGDIGVFRGVFLVKWPLPCCINSPWCPTFPHYTHATFTPCVSDHTHLLVVAPPSLPCSPPPSCLAPSLLSQASPLHRDTARSRDDGGMHSGGRLLLWTNLDAARSDYTPGFESVCQSVLRHFFIGDLKRCRKFPLLWLCFSLLLYFWKLWFYIWTAVWSCSAQPWWD